MESAHLNARIEISGRESPSIVPAIVSCIAGGLGMMMVAVAPWLLLV